MGSHLHFRSLRPGEDGVVRDLFARLSLPTRYLRFFLPLPVLSDSLLRMIGGAEDQGRIAMVAETDDIPRQVVALGNVAPAGYGRGEVGLVVADAWQRRGIGSALADRLLRAAQDCGYRKFVVYSLIGNPAVRPLLATWPTSCLQGRTTAYRRRRLSAGNRSSRHAGNQWTKRWIRPAKGCGRDGGDDDAPAATRQLEPVLPQDLGWRAFAYALGMVPSGVSLSTACGSTCASFSVSSSTDKPDFCDSCCSNSGPSVLCTSSGEIDWFGPVLTHDLTVGPRPFFSN